MVSINTHRDEKGLFEKIVDNKNNIIYDCSHLWL